VTIALEVAADFADIAEKDGAPSRRGRTTSAWDAAIAALTFDRVANHDNPHVPPCGSSPHRRFRLAAIARRERSAVRRRSTWGEAFKMFVFDRLPGRLATAMRIAVGHEE
jgi:hypothetical protein